MKTTVIVATHKPYQMPADEIYLPVQAGRALHPAVPGTTGDDTGENISQKNPHYCELTALYWAWKNLDAEVLGLAHYRRHFVSPKRRGDKWQRVLTGAEVEALLEEADAILPKKRNYFIETSWQQYVHAHHEIDLTETQSILAEVYPEYLPAWDRVMASTSGHRFNMLIMKRPQLDAYCRWLFDVLGRLEQRLDISSYSAYDARVYGFVSERLLDVWLLTNRIAVAECPVLFMEKENWPVKIANFLRRKFIGKKEQP